MSGFDPTAEPVLRRGVSQSIAAALRLALGDVTDRDVVVLALDSTTNCWSRVAGSLPVPEADVPLSGDEVFPGGRSPRVWGGSATAYPLRGSRRLLGALVVSTASHLVRSDEAGHVLDDLIRCLSVTLDAADARIEAAFIERSSHAIHRLFVEGAHAQDAREAGAVLARVAADTFQTERAGMYVVDDEGLICFAVGVGVTRELSDALAASLNGKVASRSPVWQRLEQLGGPDLVDDSRLARARPGGFVETMAFRSYVAIPLMSAEGPLGMVICGEATRTRTWTVRERELAGQFALEAALIVDAARLRSAQREQLTKLSHQAHYDGLTGLANRRLLMTRLDEALDSAQADGSTVALLLLDLNDFKRVNDTLGHRYGDQLLQEVGARLQGALRTTDTLARLGGDEFAIVLPGIAAGRRTLAAASRIEHALVEPFVLDGLSVNAVASFGIAMFPDQADSAADLLQHADVAMYAAKRSRNGAVVYDRAMDDSTVDRLTLYTELRSAIARGELRLRHQPKLDLRRNVVVGVESLVRWQHPRRGLLGPDEFLPLAEASELIHPLTAWVVEHALLQQHEWAAQGLELDLAVNMSAHNLLNEGLISDVRRRITECGSPERLVIEVTETAVMTDPQKSIRSLTAIRELGVRISMDDFGTGQSSLALLSQLPIDELKIDRQLVGAVDDSAQDRTLVDTIIHLGHRMGLQVVAEGIETSQALHTLQDLGCDLGQGYFISPPVDAAQLAELATVRRLAPGTDPAAERSVTTNGAGLLG